MGLLMWIVVGLIAGFLAGKVMKGGGFGVLMDIVIGMVGGVNRRLAVQHARNLSRRRNHRLDPGSLRRRLPPALAGPPDQTRLSSGEGA